MDTGHGNSDLPDIAKLGSVDDTHDDPSGEPHRATDGRDSDTDGSDDDAGPVEIDGHRSERDVHTRVDKLVSSFKKLVSGDSSIIFEGDPSEPPVVKDDAAPSGNEMTENINIKNLRVSFNNNVIQNGTVATGEIPCLPSRRGFKLTPDTNKQARQSAEKPDPSMKNDSSNETGKDDE